MNKTYQSIVIIFLLTALIGIGYLIFDKLDKSWRFNTNNKISNIDTSRYIHI